MNEEPATPDPVVTDKPVKKVSDKQYNHLIKARQARRCKTDKDSYYADFEMSAVDILKPHLKDLKRDLIEIRKKLDGPPKERCSPPILPPTKPDSSFGTADNPVYLIVGVGLLSLFAYGAYLARKDTDVKKKDEPLSVYF